MKEKFEEISKRLSGLGINLQNAPPLENNDETMQHMAYIDHLNHAAYEAIEEQYSKFDPNFNIEEQLQFFKRIIAIKNILRELQVIHNELTKSLCQKSAIYIHNEDDISLNEKYILPELKGKKTKEIVRANFYQLLENIKNNNSLSTAEADYVYSLLMQIVSRPGGINLIVKLNYLLTTKEAKLVLTPSNDFECSMAAAGFAKINPNYSSKSITPEQELRTILKRETVPGVGVKKILIGIDFRYNDKISSLNLDTYASTGNGLTDAGPPFILLAHELIHGLHNLTGKARYNFSPFFHGPQYRDDPLMSLLYPMSSLFSLGPAAEEYWTIEEGNLCENVIRKEHGYFFRTGHISAEPGGRGIRDLYYLGLARSYNISNLTRCQEYINLLEIEESDVDDEVVDKLLKFEKFNTWSYSLTDLIHLCKSISPYQLKKMEKIIAQFKNPGDEAPDQELLLKDFLMEIPPKMAQLFIAISKDNLVDEDKEIDPEVLDKALTTIKKINELLKASDLPSPLRDHFEQFTKDIESKADRPHRLVF
ncbi:hypothetical protein Lche_2703 [Legionella cherrii]|uniref:Uncharacterized protein n=1 Tax=Legionella cherrii TaxID=28084 RepID=A0A0W0SC69_9GAMM|nr:hypothetical protein [Legionella cherrii]KTC80683.1 hypothetical protein Lche_2703 [Legionella cherrii]